MPEPQPSSSAADRNLLFGILALQMDFIDRDALVAAMNAWVIDKAKPLGRILFEQGKLNPERLQLLDALVQEHLKAHQQDPHESLAALSPVPSVRRDLAAIEDADVQASLSTAGPVGAEDTEATVSDPIRRALGAPAVVRYRILRPHAKGGLGEVFVAHDEELHREVALKEMQGRHAGDRVSLGRFILEAEITGGLEHPGIVPVYGLGQYADGRPFYTMRFIKGDNLKEAIRRFHEADVTRSDPGRRSLAFRQLLRQFIDVCNAVAYAHSRGVLHRDLKPGNIMLGKYGETLLVDWGFAKAMEKAETGETTESTTFRPSSGSDTALTEMGLALGTPAYMSPEQAAGRLELLSPASDVYSLGATLYTVLTGQAPFSDRGEVPILERVKRGDFVTPRKLKPAVPPALESVCLKAMALRPEDRYVSAHALANDVEHWLADEPVSVYREPLATRLSRWSRRHRPLVAGAAALLLTTVVALIVGLVAVEREQRRTEEARRAEAQRRKEAREALDAMSSQVIEDWLARQKDKDLTKEQKDFLEKALAYYEQFAQDTGQGEEARAGVAGAHLRIGKIRTRLGQLAGAEAAYSKSVELYARLAADFPNVPAHRQALAKCHRNLGLLLNQTGRVKEAETVYRDALAIQQSLATDFPNVPDYRQDLARSHNNLGELFRQSRRIKEAEAAYRDALSLYQRLAADFPAIPEFRLALAGSQSNLGELFRQTGQIKEAEALHRDALAMRQRLAADFPNVPEYRQDLAKSHNNLGVLLYRTARAKEAEAVWRDALAIRQRLAADFPNVPAYRKDLALSHNNLGALLAETGRPKEAETMFRDALDIYQRLAADFPNVPDYQNELANSMTNLAELQRDRKEFRLVRKLLEQALAHHEAALKANPRNPFYRECFRNNRQALAATLIDLADHTASAATAVQLLQIAVDPPKDAYRAAGFLARCVSLAEKDTKIPEAKRKELARNYGDQAVAALQKAVQKGYADVVHAKSDKDLDSIRSREDFKKLVAELEKNVAPEKTTK